jgi:perosamine synthetase
MSDSFIPLGRPDITEGDISAVIKVLRSGQLIQGECVRELESDFSAYTGTTSAIAVSNGTATLHLALRVLDIGPGDEVIVPAFSYIATANVVELVGAKPVFVDIDLPTFNLDANQLEQAISIRTKAIIPVHEFGLCCDIEAICRIAKKRGIPVIEDAACALGATQRDKQAGSFGLLGSFSLHPRKSITSGEGGVLVTDDAALSAKLRQLRNHGIEMLEGKMQFSEAGFNYRMTDFQAALAHNQFQRFNEILQYKKELAKIYFSEIRHSDIRLPKVPSDRLHTWQTFHLLLPPGMDQYRTIERLKEKNIGTNYGAQCIPAQEFYRRKYGEDAAVLYPRAFTAFSRGLAIPLYERLRKEDAHYIAQIINQL